MDKRQLANQEAKTKIVKALFSLMEEKDFSKISVTDITTRAGVARATFYRNYNSKTDILTNYLDMLTDDFRATADFERHDYRSYDTVVHKFRYYQKYRKELLILYKSGFSFLVLSNLNQYVEQEAGDMESNSIERYELYYFAGAFFNVVIKWMLNGMQETPEEMAEAFCRFQHKK